MHTYSAHMTSDVKQERAGRLKLARERAGYKTAAEFARALDAGLDDYTYRTYESGSRGISFDYADRFAAKLGVSAQWLLTGKVEFSGISSAPIRGTIKDGGIINATSSLTGSAGMNGAESQGTDSSLSLAEDFTSAFFALTVDTKQFEPHTNRGSVVYYSRTPQNPEECIGSPCIVQIKGGQPVFAVLLRGSRKGVYDIQGHGQDLEIEWCAKREFTKHA